MVGALFVGHGCRSWPAGSAGAGSPAPVSGWSRSGCGLFFGLGLFNPLGTVFICAVMLMAIARVHWPKGLWVTNGGCEYPLTIIAPTVAVAMAGPGRYALDPYLGVALPLAPVLVAGLLIAFVVAAIVARPHPAVRTDMRRTA